MANATLPLLAVDDLHVSYGDLAALRGVSIAVDPGEMVCVIGPNGAGKSTLLAAIAGGVAPLRGSVRFGDRDLVALSPDRIARVGLSLVPEGRHIFGALTVRENLLVGSFMRNNRKESSEDVVRVLTYFPALKARLNFPAGRLSGGEQQMLAIGRALMARPRLILIDEPSLGLAPRIVDQIYDILCDLRRADGLTLLINEQSSHRVLKHADRIYVVRAGEIQLHGRAAELQDGEAIKDAYFGFGHRHSAVGETLHG
jgi:branched-chain amino acid transport system ATP-binding protein